MTRSHPRNSIAITGGYVVPVEGEPIDGGTVLIIDGRIAAVGGPGLKPPPGVDVRDALLAGLPGPPGFTIATSGCRLYF